MGNEDNRSRLPPDDVETLRQIAIDNVRALKRENAPRISDPSFTNHTSYNYGRWADRGFNTALGFLDNTAPQTGETGPDSLRRVVALVRAERDKYRDDEADEDGACSGALDAAMWAIIKALPKEPSDDPS